MLFFITPQNIIENNIWAITQGVFSYPSKKLYQCINNARSAETALQIKSFLHHSSEQLLTGSSYGYQTLG